MLIKCFCKKTLKFPYNLHYYTTSESWYIQNSRHIQNTVKHLTHSEHCQTMAYGKIALKTRPEKSSYIFSEKAFLMFQEMKLSYISGNRNPTITDD